MAYTASATTVAGRNGHVESSDKLLQFDLSLPKELGGPGKPNTTNPEMLFAAGYSACFGSAIEAVSHAEKIDVKEITVTAEVTLHKEENNFYLAVVLRPRLDGVDHATAERLVHRAHEVCPYSKATRNNIKVSLELA